MTRHVVIVGAGHAGVQLVDGLRSNGHSGPITLIGDEEEYPYHRPLLSKEFLGHQASPEMLPLRSPTFFDDLAVEYRAGARVVSLAPGRQLVTLHNGAEVPYDDLVLATGSTPRELAFEMPQPEGVHLLRTAAQARLIRHDLEQAREVVVVGAGFVGLEVAALVRSRGINVTVLEQGDQVLARALTDQMGKFLLDAHRQAGVSIHLAESVADLLSQDGRVTGVRSTSGLTYPADLVVVGIGASPDTRLAAQAGLSVDGGVMVDDLLRSSDRHIWAIGDCASFARPGVVGGRLRLESVQNATDQAAALAKTLTGEPTRYSAVPWFWSVQGQLRLQIAGLSAGADLTVVRGEPDSSRFSIYCFRSGQLVAVESMNSPRDHVIARGLLSGGVRLDPCDLARIDLDLKSLSRLNPPDKAESTTRPHELSGDL